MDPAQLDIDVRIDRRRTRSEVGNLVDDMRRVYHENRRSLRAYTTKTNQIAISGLRRFSSKHKSAFRDAVRDTRALERSYDRLGGRMDRINRGMGSFLRNITSVRSLMLGMGVGVAGKGLFDLFVGSNSRLEQSMITFETMLGSKGRAQTLIKQLDAYSARTPFQAEEVMEASRRLTRSSGKDLGRNLDLVDLSAQMSSMSPSKTLVDAAEAILDAEMGEFERLKEFGVKIRIRDIEKRIKATEGKSRKATSGEILEEVQRKFAEMTGGRNLVEMQSQSAAGRISTLIDKVKLQMRDLGKPAFKAFADGISTASKQLDTVMQDKTFQQDLKELAGGIERTISLTAELITKAPAAYKQARQFLDENGNALLALGGLYGANKLTGGALARGAGGLTKSALFGRGGGAGAGGVAGMAGVQRVWVVNMGKGGLGGSPSFTGRNSKLLGAGGLTAAEAGSMGFGGGGIMGAGGLAAGGAAVLGVGTIAMSLYAFHKALSTTTNTVAAYEKREAERLAAMKAREAAPSNKLGAREQLLYGQAIRTGNLSGRLRSQDFEGAKGAIFQMLGGSKARYTGTPEQQKALALANEILQREGAGKFVLSEGQRVNRGRFVGGREGLTEEQKSFLGRLPELSRMLKANPSLADDPRVRADNARAEGLNRVLGQSRRTAEALNAASPLNVNINIYGPDEAAGQRAGAAAVNQIEAYYTEIERKQALLAE